ncbi:MAG: tRNA pseudouridine(38-40) synthase TruA [candidate division WOR-3 bacterium]|nr:MAG: tRNA pseudouridine(38-40) synthase TruA [candidate division WOR-3 bacterium]
MRNLSIIIEYDGTRFFGWQYQPNKRTVQGEIQTALKKVIGGDVKLTGAGRTDHGVHALGQVANFHTASQLPLLSIKKGINSLTGDDVYIRDIGVVADDFNSRFSAKSKVYDYRIALEPSPFRLRYSWYVKQVPDIALMQRAIPSLIGQRDFAGFAVQNGSENTVCNVHEISVNRESNQIYIRVRGDRFLRKMVRGLVGFMVDIGRGRFSLADVSGFFDGSRTGINFAPPQGLFLVSIEY